VSELTRSLRRVLRTLGRWVLLGPIRFYRRWISPALPASCRYYPSCAAYAEEAVSRHGPIHGGWLAVRRLGRCHPWTPGGVDHVPGSPKAAESASDFATGHPSTLTGA
jgi:putative membrane protein insertion efficiency factor